ncbi:FAD synthetase, chloroplastic-like [Iris pallida]|uniref:FAD synthase n=1 Tax=Iris pallida TaxID=29817 RepID=A0AAX6HDR2_IRIPA|nr:FAD synthetase, chloroplastic-like [Iris pallida]
MSASILASSIFSPLAPLRSCICLNEGRSGVLRKAKNNTHIARGIFSSYGSQGTKLTSEDMSKDKFLIDCVTDQECVVGGIVALGKFDALHLGHRELAIQASKIGIPFLLSFVGMAEVLGWPSRPPVVAKCDRKRVLSSWAPHCGNVVPLEFEVEFSNVRHLTPREFVEKLSKDLRVNGVVAGENYRFGYRASGDARELVNLCKEYGLDVVIVNNVMDKSQESAGGNGKVINSGDKGQVSSTRVRQALAMGDMEHVAQLLGRKHRLVLSVNKEWSCPSSKRVLVPKSCMLNLPPGDGKFDGCTLLVDDILAGPCKVAITPENLDIQLDSGNFQNMLQDGRFVGIEFG